MTWLHPHLSVQLSVQLAGRRQVWQRCCRKPRAPLADEELCRGDVLVLLCLQENTSYGTPEATAEIAKQKEESRQKEERNKKKHAVKTLFKVQVQTGSLSRNVTL